MATSLACIATLPSKLVRAKARRSTLDEIENLLTSMIREASLLDIRRAVSTIPMVTLIAGTNNPTGLSAS